MSESGTVIMSNSTGGDCLNELTALVADRAHHGAERLIRARRPECRSIRQRRYSRWAAEPPDLMLEVGVLVQNLLLDVGDTRRARPSGEACL